MLSLYFVYALVSVKYNKTLKHCHFLCMKYTALGESLVTNTALGFASVPYLPLDSHLVLYISYKLAAVL